MLADALWYDVADEAAGDPPLWRVALQVCTLASLVALAAGLRLLVLCGTSLARLHSVLPGLKLPADPDAPFRTGR